MSGRRFPWLKLYTEIVHDEKIADLSREHRWFWVSLLCLARGSSEPGVINMRPPKIAWTLHEDVPYVVAGLRACEKAGLVVVAEGRVEIPKFVDRQPFERKPEPKAKVAARKRAQRDRGMSRSVTGDVTQRDRGMSRTLDKSRGTTGRANRDISRDIASPDGQKVSPGCGPGLARVTEPSSPPSAKQSHGPPNLVQAPGPRREGGFTC